MLLNHVLTLAQIDSVYQSIQALPDDTAKIKMLLNYGEPREDGQFDLCQKVYTQAAAIAENISNDFYLSKSNNYLGILCRKYGRNKEALVYFNKSEEAAQRCKNEFRIAAAQTNMASIFMNENRLKEAAIKLQQSISTYEKLNMDKPMVQALGNLSNLYNLQGAYTLAVETAQKGLTLALKINDPDLIANLQINKASPLIRLEKMKEAESLSRESLSYFRNKKPGEKLFHCYQSLGAVLGNSKNYVDASLYADSAIAVAVQLNMPKLKIQSMLQRANLATKRSDFGYAEQLLKEVKSLKHKTSEWSLLLEIERTEYLLDAAKGEYKSALAHLTRELEFNDSLKNENTVQQNIDLDKKYAVLKKKQQIDQLQSEKEYQLKEIKQKNLWIGLSIGVAIIILGWLGLLYLTIQRKRSLDRQIIIQLQQEKTLKAATDILQAQEEERLRFARDLHDGLGSLLSGVKLSLSSIQAETFRNSEQKNLFENSIVQMEYAIQEMRKISRNMMPETIQQYGLQAAVQNLCESLQTSSSPLIRFECLDFNHRLIADQEIVAYRIIQELLQNAIRHSRSKTIFVQLTHHEKTMHLVVEDDGIGYDRQNPQTGMGTKNIKSRVEFLNGVMHIQSHSETGTSVHIEFPATER